jgi:hypothetical protein
LYKNLERVAVVWMDYYYKYYAHTTGKVSAFSGKEKASIQTRKDLRERLQCHDFSWYLSNVATNILVPPREAFMWGQLKSMRIVGCLNVSTNGSLTLDYCTLYLDTQTFYYNQNSQIVHQPTMMCLTSSNLSVHLHTCNTTDIRQTWMFKASVPSILQQYVQGVDTRKPVGMFWTEEGGTKYCLSDKHLEYKKFIPGTQRCDNNDVHQYWGFLHNIYYRTIMAKTNKIEV